MLLGDLIIDVWLIWMLIYFACIALSISWLAIRYQNKKMTGRQLARMILLVLMLSFSFFAIFFGRLADSIAY